MVNRGLSIYDVIPAGFEPTTHSLEGCCSIQLSYETIFQKKSFAKVRDFLQLSNTYRQKSNQISHYLPKNE